MPDKATDRYVVRRRSDTLYWRESDSTWQAAKANATQYTRAQLPGAIELASKRSGGVVVYGERA